MYHPRLRGNHYDMGRHYGAVACWLFALYCFESNHGCSVFAVRSGEHTYFGRNMDMFPEYKKTSESALYMPENKNIFLAHSTAMICVEDGVNEHGLAAALTFLLPKTVKPGINGGFLIRLILEECKTAEEATKLLQNIPISSAHNIVVADRLGEMFVAECAAEQVSVRWCEKYAAELLPVLSAMQSALGVSMEQTKKVFLTVFLFAHGYASIIANNSLKYDEELINSQLERAYRGAILAAQEEMA